jgi:hypothetical protein
VLTKKQFAGRLWNRFPVCANIAETKACYQSGRQLNPNRILEVAMNAISAVLIQAVPETNTESHPIRTIALYCCLGLVASLCLAMSGLDLSVGLS